jgi:site-specific recombinase XerD
MQQCIRVSPGIEFGDRASLDGKAGRHERAKLPFGVHAHMLRHACGYALANAGHDTCLIQDWLGHRAIQHTARYTELSPTRSKDVWRCV